MEELEPTLEMGLASMTIRTAIRCSSAQGPKVRETLAKGVPVDLHPDHFSNHAAVTMVAHIGVIMWQSGQDRFTLAVFRSYSGGFWHWLSASAAPSGLVVEP